MELGKRSCDRNIKVESKHDIVRVIMGTSYTMDLCLITEMYDDSRLGAL
jgi:hypothetical protein